MVKKKKKCVVDGWKVENIKWVFKCIKRHLDLINTPDSLRLCSCTVNDHPSKEQNYNSEYVFKRCFAEAFFDSPNTLLLFSHFEAKCNPVKSSGFFICNLLSGCKEYQPLIISTLKPPAWYCISVFHTAQKRFWNGVVVQYLVLEDWQWVTSGGGGTIFLTHPMNQVIP